MSRKLRILIVEPSVIITTGLQHVLAESGRYDVHVCQADAEMLTSRLEQYKPDIAVVNPTILSMVKRSSLRSLVPDGLHTSFVALVYQYVEPQVLKLFNGVLDIRESAPRIVDLMTEVNAASVADEAETDNYELTERETAVLVLVAKGMMSKEIADKLNISIHTVISHRKNITRKTGIRSVAGLAVYAMLHNLIDLEKNDDGSRIVPTT